MPIVPICPENDDRICEEERGTQKAEEASHEETGNGYEVGYGRPPKHTQFRKGQSGNRKGRPRSAKSVNTIIRDEMLAKVMVRTRDGERRISRAQALVMKLLETGAKGNVRAILSSLDLLAKALPDLPVPNDADECANFTEADQRILEDLKVRLLEACK